jgi:hypothetical protein
VDRRGFLASALAALVFEWRRPIASLLADAVAGTRSFAGPPVHPDPRPGVTAERVLDTAEIRAKPRVAELYDMAREIPQLFDGLFCYCQCHEGPRGHRSLLVCFESAQAAGCYGCGAEARVAHKAYKEGKSLDEIRAECDKKFA